MGDAAPALLIVLITILFPPVGVGMVAGCGFDLFVNICLTILGCKSSLCPRHLVCASVHNNPPLHHDTDSIADFPGHIHAFYIEYVYFDRRDRARRGELTGESAPGVYSDRVQSGGQRQQGYGTL